jgi:malonate transporter
VNYIQLLAPDFSLILLGFLLCRYTALNRTVWEQAEKLVFFVFFPVLLFHSIVRSPLDLSATAGLIAGGMALAASGIALAYALPWVPWLGGRLDRREHAACAQIAFRFNSFIALAMAERLAGAEGLLLIAVLIGVCVPMFNTAAIWPMARHSQTHFGRELVRNPFIIATVSGLLFNFLGLHIPGWLEPSVSRIGAGSLALGLMAAGAGMRLGSLAQAKALSIAVLLIKHLLMPLVALLLSHVLGLSKAQSLVLLAFSALPTAPTAYLLAARMGYNGPLVAGLVTLSTLLGLLSLPLAIALAGLTP